MINNNKAIPLYARGTIILIGIIALLALLYLARIVIIPIIFAVIIAIVLHPVVNFFLKIKVNRIVAILITILLTFLIICALGLLTISQLSRFTDSLPVLIEKFRVILDQAIIWTSGYFDINPLKINDWITKTQGDLINSGSAAIGQTLVILGNALVIFFLLPVYIFLILFYHPLLIEFIHRIFGSGDQVKVSTIIKQVKTLIHGFLVGLAIEAFIIAALETTALLILGIEYAFLLGILGALLNVIPYIGGLVAVALPMIVALATKSSPITALYILVIYYIIQLVDNNYIVPKIVASKVKVNALFSIVAVIAGNMLWGIPGMFLSIPILAITKLICDHVEPLKPWGFLLGDTMPPILKIKVKFKKPIKLL